MKSRVLQQYYEIVQQQQEQLNTERAPTFACFSCPMLTNCSRNNKKQKEMRVFTEHGETGEKTHKYLLPEAVPENFRFITTQSPPRILWYLDNSLI